MLTIDDTDSPRDLIDALGLVEFVAGHQPHAATRELANVRDDATLPPPADQAVLMGFWYATTRGPQRHPRPITAQPWADIRSN